MFTAQAELGHDRVMPKVEVVTVTAAVATPQVSHVATPPSSGISRTGSPSEPLAPLVVLQFIVGEVVPPLA